MTKSIDVKNTVFIGVKDAEMVTYISNGYRSKEIAAIYDISVRTVEARLDKIRTKTGCKSLPQLVATFLRNKLIE